MPMAEKSFIREGSEISSREVGISYSLKNFPVKRNEAVKVGSDGLDLVTVLNVTERALSLSLPIEGDYATAEPG